QRRVVVHLGEVEERGLVGNALLAGARRGEGGQPRAAVLLRHGAGDLRRARRARRQLHERRFITALPVEKLPAARRGGNQSAMGLAVVTSQSGTRDTSSGQEPVVK